MKLPDVLIPTYVQMLGALSNWLGKAEAQIPGGGADFVPRPSDRGIRYEIDEKNVVSALHAGGPSIQSVEGCL